VAAYHVADGLPLPADLRERGGVVADLNRTADALVTLANIVHHPPDLFDPLAARHHVENKAGHHLLARVLQAVFSPRSAAWFAALTDDSIKIITRSLGLIPWPPLWPN
jgi:hypothetical protein